MKAWWLKAQLCIHNPVALNRETPKLCDRRGGGGKPGWASGQPVKTRAASQARDTWLSGAWLVVLSSPTLLLPGDLGLGCLPRPHHSQGCKLTRTPGHENRGWPSYPLSPFLPPSLPLCSFIFLSLFHTHRYLPSSRIVSSNSSLLAVNTHGRGPSSCSGCCRQTAGQGEMQPHSAMGTGWVLLGG